jgi:formate hydrogenlyase subunit 6/NADH:ubiquinone oxidoreductase subunit I
MLRDTLLSLFRRPNTEQYPAERVAVPDHLRGKLEYSPEGCTGCQLCVKDCPAEAIEMKVIDKAAKRFVMVYHADRCTFCAQCVQNCRFDCIKLLNDSWELASDDRSDFKVYYGREEDVRLVLESEAAPVAETAPAAE